MPKYDYKCDECQVVQEYDHSMAETKDLHVCEMCDVGFLHKVFQPQATHFKGQGWGKTYRIHPGSKNK